jgi:hypothetical protein
MAGSGAAQELVWPLFGTAGTSALGLADQQGRAVIEAGGSCACVLNAYLLAYWMTAAGAEVAPPSRSRLDRGIIGRLPTGFARRPLLPLTAQLSPEAWCAKRLEAATLQLETGGQLPARSTRRRGGARRDSARAGPGS